MWRLDRNTARRGRSVVPLTRLRTRRWRLTRASAVRTAIVPLLLLPGLAGLAQDALAGVADALALVGLGLADLADVGRHLADELLVGPPDGDTGGARDLEGDPVGGVDVDGVRETEGQLDLVGPLGGGPVADADDLELPREPVGHPDHHVVDQRPGEAVEGAVLPLVGRPGDDQLVAFPGHGDVGHQVALQRALGALHDHVRAVEGHVDTGGDGNRLPADAGHGAVTYQTWQRTSPPTRRSRASRSVRRPWLVERMSTPMPPRTRPTLSAIL